MAHGALLGGFISTVSTNVIANCRSDITEMPVAVALDKVRFLAPVFLDDTVTVSCENSEIDLDSRRSYASVKIHNQDGVLVGVATHILQWVKND